MSATPTVRPALPAAAAAEIAGRYAQGARLADLVAEYRVWTNQVKRAVRRAGLTLRPEDTAPRLCRVCDAPGAGATQRPLCARHIREFCSRCETPLESGRVNRWCSGCEAAKKQRLWAKPGRCCTICDEPVTGRSGECVDCLRARYELERQATQHVAKRCCACESLMPRGRRSARCARCYRRHERSRRRLRQIEGRHRCVVCGGALPLSRASYCAGCGVMIENWRQAYHAGDPVARRLGQVEPRRRWQEQKAA